MIDVNRIKLQKIPVRRLQEFFNIWWVKSQHKAIVLKFYCENRPEMERILKNQCDSLIKLHYKVREEWRKKTKKKSSDIFYFKFYTGIGNSEDRVDHCREGKKKFSPDFIDHKTRGEHNENLYPESKYQWAKERFQHPLFKCKTCGKLLYNAEERLAHAQKTFWKHNKVNELNWPVLAEHPHYICPKCNRFLPRYYVKSCIKKHKGTVYCVFCNFKGIEKDLKFEDPFYDEQLQRICLNCFNEYKLCKTRWYAQGLLCPACKEKEETRLKNLKRKKNTP